ncbi:MAG: holo-[acyl-carrier-protein] synthase [Pedosphaera sp.]|jgi:holo-[acyl-carrier protein] synthase|nr:holo-[acyl-carrier-protein] synthase [Pedosphaera sp.]
MILGVGIDLVEVGRIRDSLERLGERFARRILCPAEYDYCFSHTDPSTHVAARFAAKEAVSKAFGTGIGTELGWLDIEVIRLESGSTQVRLQGAGTQLMERRSAKIIHLNLTHTAQYASAVAILEG